MSRGGRKDMVPVNVDALNLLLNDMGVKPGEAGTLIDKSNSYFSGVSQRRKMKIADVVKVNDILHIPLEKFVNGECNIARVKNAMKIYDTVAEEESEESLEAQAMAALKKNTTVGVVLSEPTKHVRVMSYADTIEDAGLMVAEKAEELSELLRRNGSIDITIHIDEKGKMIYTSDLKQIWRGANDKQGDEAVDRWERSAVHDSGSYRSGRHWNIRMATGSKYNQLG